MIDKLSPEDPLLQKVGDIFAIDGIHDAAVKAYLKVSNIDIINH